MRYSFSSVEYFVGSSYLLPTAYFNHSTKSWGDIYSNWYEHNFPLQISLEPKKTVSKLIQLENGVICKLDILIQIDGFEGVEEMKSIYSKKNMKRNSKI